VAGAYLTAGFILVWRRGDDARPVRPTDMHHWVRPVAGPRAEFVTILAASVTGLTISIAVQNAETDALQVAGAVAIVMAWTLLHAGYARFYGSLTAADDGGAALEFPRGGGALTSTDFFYFAFTIGTSFAVSDVLVTSPKMRWHVMTHSVLSFFYNAAILAVAIAIVTGR
jgi:uncharacterized membrane protein